MFFRLSCTGVFVSDVFNIMQFFNPNILILKNNHNMHDLLL